MIGRAGAPPRPVYALALLGGAGAFVVVLFVLLRFGFTGLPAIALSGAAVGTLAMGLGLVWPTPSWRWGFWAGGAFGIFFLFVFVSFLVNGRLEWSPALDALAVLAAGCLGAQVGSWMAGRLRNPSAAD